MTKTHHTATPLGRSAAGIVARLRRGGHRAWFAGGAVRDMILGRALHDIDIATSARPAEVAALFPRARAVGAAFGVMLVPWRRRWFEVATFRSEGGYSDGRHPDRVEFSDERADALRRDFTCNALYCDPETHRVIDLVGGRADIRRRLLRAVGNPRRRFAEDHLRILRVARFAGALGFRVHPRTAAAARSLAPSLRRISAERVRDELLRMLAPGGTAARRSLELVQQLGLLRYVLPGMDKLVGLEQPAQFHPEGDAWTHTLCCLERLRPGSPPAFALAVLLHDIGKGVTARRDSTGRMRFNNHAERGAPLAGALCRRLKTSTAERELVEELVGGHMRFKDLQNMRPGRLKRLLRSPNFRWHLELHRIDCLSSHRVLDNWRFALKALRQMPAEELRPPRLLSGHDLLGLGYRQGPGIGEILRALEEEQLEGRLTTREEAVAWLQDHPATGRPVPAEKEGAGESSPARS